MSRRLNERFLACYIELEKNCGDKFGVSAGGVTEYINRLNNARFAPGRDEALPRLVRYRGIRNKMVHDIASLRKESEITKVDIAWIKRFNRDVAKHKDPISVYLRKARGYARRKKIARIGIISLVALLLIAVAVLFFVFK